MLYINVWQTISIDHHLDLRYSASLQTIRVVAIHRESHTQSYDDDIDTSFVTSGHELSQNYPSWLFGYSVSFINGTTQFKNSFGFIKTYLNNRNVRLYKVCYVLHDSTNKTIKLL